jgi:Tfp pilus assembly protein PilN
MRAVNLLPRDDPNRRTKTNVPVVIGVAGAVLTTALIGMMYMSASSSVHDRQQQLDALRAELAVVPPPVQQSSAQAGLAEEQKARVTAVSTAMSRRVAWDRVLREVTLVLPEDVWLLSLAGTSPASPGSLAAPTVSTSGVPTGFTLQGYTYSQDGVARVLSRLMVVPDLSDVQLATSTSALIGTQNIVQFTIVANVRPPLGAAS